MCQGGGLIVNICSVASYVDLPLGAAYCASKAALLALTNIARMELAPLGVAVMGAPLFDCLYFLPNACLPLDCCMPLGRCAAHAAACAEGEAACR